MTTRYLALSRGPLLPLEGDSIFIGRVPNDPGKHHTAIDVCSETARCDGDWIYLPDPFVSRRHALLTRTSDGCHAIEDLGSRGETFVNDQAVTEPTVLQPGDRIRVGRLTIEYCEEIPLPPDLQLDRFASD
jgi:hypothetical protein